MSELFAPNYLRFIKSEALCDHTVRIGPGAAAFTAVLDHAGSRRVVRLEPLSSSGQDRQVRQTLHDWLLEIHVRAAA